MNGIKMFNRTMLLATAPFIGLLLWLVVTNLSVSLSISETNFDTDQEETKAIYTEIDQGLLITEQLTSEVTAIIEQDYSLYKKTNDQIYEISQLIKQATAIPLEKYDQRITALLGKPAATINTKNLRAQLFFKNHTYFKSYLVKIQLKSDDAMTMVMGGDELGEAMTTMEAAKKHGAAVAVNAGGFAEQDGKIYPLGTTIVDGEYIQGFHPSKSDLFFVGMSQNNNLIGGKYKTKEQLDARYPKFGATFVPILLRNGQAQVIPDKWKTNSARAPRTVIANYEDKQLLILVTDGYDTNGSKGASLQELQTILKSYGVIDAYNLDGGGSSSLVFNGQLINHPSDGKLRELPTHFLFFR